jgi:NTP pyrophosphatase (non-canonical NTP hydrolase)
MDLLKIQKRVFKNKIDKGFNVDNIEKEFCFLIGEVSEAFEAYNKKQESLGSELADIAIYLLGLSEMLGINLSEELNKKILVNENREYMKVNGANVKK